MYSKFSEMQALTWSSKSVLHMKFIRFDLQTHSKNKKIILQKHRWFGSYYPQLYQKLVPSYYCGSWSIFQSLTGVWTCCASMTMLMQLESKIFGDLTRVARVEAKRLRLEPNGKYLVNQESQIQKEELHYYRKHLLNVEMMIPRGKMWDGAGSCTQGGEFSPISRLWNNSNKSHSSTELSYISSINCKSNNQGPKIELFNHSPDTITWINPRFLPARSFALSTLPAHNFSNSPQQ